MAAANGGGQVLPLADVVQCHVAAPTGANHAVQVQIAPPTVGNAGGVLASLACADTEEDRARPTRADLSSAIRTVLVGKDLDKMTLKELRRAVVAYMAFGGRKLKRSLEEGRREEFAELAKNVIAEMQAIIPVSQPLKPDWYDMEDEDANAQIYFVTFAHILYETAANSVQPLKTLDTITKRLIADVMLDAIAHPAVLNKGGRPANEELQILKMVVVEEVPKHFHVALKLSRRCTYMQFKTRIREASGLASHWSVSHRHFWSTVRYLAFTTDKKRGIDPKPFSWTPSDRTSGEALDIYEEAQEPYCAEICRKRREKAEMRAFTPDEPEAKRSKGTTKQPRFNKSDFCDLVLSRKLKTPAAAMGYLHDHGSEAARAFAQKNQRRLQEFIEDAEEWERAPAKAKKEQRGDWDMFLEAANTECPSGASCIYAEAATTFFQAHAASFSQTRLAVALRGIIIFGPSKDWRVPFLIGSTNTGKSTIVESVESIFEEDEIFHLPAGTDNKGGALRSWLKDKRFVFWDEFQPVKFIGQGVLDLSQFLKAFNGQFFEIQMNQRNHDGNKPFKWQRGAIFTGKECGLWQPRDGVTEEDISHLQSRVDLFRCVGQIKRRQGGVPKCRCCFARWVCESAAHYDASQALAAPIVKAGVVCGLASLLAAAQIQPNMVAAIEVDVSALGAVHVRELGPTDWPLLPSWTLLREMEKRRLLAAIR